MANEDRRPPTIEEKRETTSKKLRNDLVPTL